MVLIIYHFMEISQALSKKYMLSIYVNVLELCKNGQVLNAKYSDKRATDYLKQFCDPNFKVEPEYEDWETDLHNPPPINNLI